MGVVSNTNVVCPTDSDLEDRSFVLACYQDYLSSYDQNAVAATADAELAARQQEVFGNTDYGMNLTQMAANPALVADGAWGFSHAGLAVTALLGLTGTALDDEIEYQRAFYYTRESKARCDQGQVADAKDSLTWSEDSRLDYYAVVAFTEWYKDQV